MKPNVMIWVGFRCQLKCLAAQSTEGQPVVKITLNGQENPCSKGLTSARSA